MKVDKVRVGLVGLGLVSSAHIKGYVSHPLAEVIAVCDLDESQVQAVARKFDIPRCYTSYDEMLRDTDINTIDVTTPTYLHRPMAVAAARAGKHIHCEKPLALTLAEGEQMCSEAEKHHVALAVDETYVFMATVMKARRLIDAGEIGKPRQIRQRFGAWLDRPGVLRAVHDGRTNSEQWRADSGKAGGNGFPWQFDHNIHFFATAQYLMNDSPVEKVYSVKADNSWFRDEVHIETSQEACGSVCGQHRRRYPAHDLDVRGPGLPGGLDAGRTSQWKVRLHDRLLGERHRRDRPYRAARRGRWRPAVEWQPSSSGVAPRP